MSISGLNSYLEIALGWSGTTTTTADESLRLDEEALLRTMQRIENPVPTPMSPRPIDRTSWHDGSVKVDKVYAEEPEGLAALAKREKELCEKKHKETK